MDHTRKHADSPSTTADVVAHAVRRLHRTGRLLAAELSDRRGEGLGAPMEAVESNAVNLRYARAVPLDRTGSDAEEAMMGLCHGRGELSFGWSSPRREAELV